MPRPHADTALTLVLLGAGMLLLRAIWPLQVEPMLRLVLERNAVAITHLDQPRRIVESREVLVDRLDLARGGRLRHAELGDIGYAEHFFLTLRKRFTVRAAGDYRFVIASDDGFSLRLDSRPLCADPRPRALNTQVCGLHLEAGEHEFALDYFQGSGQSGLSLQYGRQDQARNFWFGEDSEHFRFARERAD